MRGWVIAVMLGTSGCGAAAALDLARPWTLHAEDGWDPRASSVTHRFASPVMSLDVGRDGACAQLEGDVVECWGSGAIGSERAMDAPLRTRFRAAAPIESMVFDDRPCVGTVGGAVHCAGAVGWRTVPRSEPEPEPEDDDGTYVYPFLRDTLTTPCELDGAEIACSFPLPGGDVICINGHEGEPCSDAHPRPPVRLSASADVVTARIEDGMLCAALVDDRYECWTVPGRRFYFGANEREDLSPRPIGLLVGTEPPAAGYGRACAVHRDDARLVTCVGVGPLGAESTAGAVGLPHDPWTRAFLGVTRAATSGERALEPDMPALCTGRRRDDELGPYTCVLRPERASRKQMAVRPIEWAEAVPDGTARLSFDGANFCIASADHVLRCQAEGRRELRLTDVREHAAGPGTLYWVDRQGVAWCAGNNLSVQCQDDGPREVRYPHRIAVPRVSHLAAGATHACAVTTDGAVWCWGENADLQVTGAALLDGSGTLRASDEEIQRFLIDAPAYCSPTEVLPPGSAVDVACGAYTTCVAREDGSSFCW